MAAFWSGLWLGFSLIIAIGSQNAFVLKQGLKREFVFIICLICAVSDAVLIAIGVSGFYVIINQLPWVEPMARIGGGIFLLIYGLKSFWSAFTHTGNLTAAKKSAPSLALAVSTCLAFTWLNPHVYLDTVVLLGSISTQYVGHKMEFALGAVLASFLFFFSLGYGARLLAPVFEKPLAWKVLDFMIGIIMLSIAARLFFH